MSSSNTVRTLLRLRNTIQNYGWGSRTALAQLMGRRHPSQEPEAELWVGAHPKAPSTVELDGRDVLLTDLLAEYPREILGADALDKHGPRLPFLLKILAAESPLSLQAHPNARQAEAGFSRENQAGIALDAPERFYRDPWAKQELVCALSDFPVLSGMRNRDEIAALLEQVDLGMLRPLLDALTGGTPREALRTFFTCLISLPFEAKGLTEELAERCRAVGSRAHSWVARLQEAYPHDPAILAPIFLNLVELSPGEALYTRPQTLHCYLGGMAVELMTNSDCVLRAGLTVKPVDSGALLEILELEERPTVPMAPGGRHTTPDGSLILERSVFEPATAARRIESGVHAEIVLCVRGSLLAKSSGDAAIELTAGEAVLAPAIVAEYTLRGNGTAYRAFAR